jgi:hypothetical protein
MEVTVPKISSQCPTCPMAGSSKTAVRRMMGMDFGEKPNTIYQHTRKEGYASRLKGSLDA